MTDRRTFIRGAAAATLLRPGLAAAHVEAEPVVPTYDVPVEHLPRHVSLEHLGLRPDEIHVYPWEFALYWTLPDGQAIRYTVGVGRPGLYEDGEFYVGMKRRFPRWTPTPGMLRREPELYEKHRDGIPGGLENPLGARALYLFQPGRGDTLLRIHGTHLPETLARAVSNGCARLINDQIVDFYDRVPIGTRVVLHPQPENFGVY